MQNQLILSLILFGLLFIGTGCEEKQEKIKPQFQALTESVYASVTVLPEGLYQVYPSANGVIEAMMVEENQIVTKGEKVAQIKNTLPQVNIEKAQLNTRLATQNYERQTDVLQSIEDEIQAAQLKLQTDSLNYYRQKKLWNQNIGSQVQFENKKLAYELSVNTLLALRNAYRRNKSEMKNQLATQVKLAESSLKSSKVSNNDFVIRSNIYGKVYEVFKNTGESVLVQEPLATIGAANQFIIEMEVDEVDIAQLQIGQKVLLNLDAYSQEVFEANISKIYPKKEVRTQTFKVESIFRNPPQRLYAGLSGEANIIISQKEKIMTIPLSYLWENNKVKTEDGLISIKTGLRDMEKVEVISGIDTNTYLIKPE